MEDLRGKRLPVLDRIEIYPIEDQQPRYLAFLNKEHDLLDKTPFAFIDQVLPKGKLALPLAREGVRVFREEAPELTYDVFNLDDMVDGRENVIGGYGPERVALRRAMVLAHDRGQEIEILRKGQALPAQSPVPPGVVGYDPSFHAASQDFDPARAKALLDMFGYRDRDGDGWRELPDGEERNRLYREMNRLLLAYAPVRLGVHRIFSHLQYPWVKGYKKHPILYTNFKWLDLDVAAQQVVMK